MTLAEQLELACLMEATARKPGNVHPGARFADLCYDDFVRAAEQLGPDLERSFQRNESLGVSILSAVKVTRSLTVSNANLGIILLLAPLASVASEIRLHDGVPAILHHTTIADSVLVFEAIRRAQPGGLGDVPDQDVRHLPTMPLRDVMTLAADRDLIARQYAEDYLLVEATAFQLQSTWKALSSAHCGSDLPGWEAAILGMACELMANYPDSLIARKCGPAIAQEARQRASHFKGTIWPLTDQGRQSLCRFDQWLRADGHRRNPGTTADLVAACLFWAIREGYIQPPTKAEVLEHARKIAANGPSVLY